MIEPTFPVILLLMFPQVNGDRDCCGSSPTRMTIQSIIKQPLPLIVNSQVVEDPMAVKTVTSTPAPDLVMKNMNSGVISIPSNDETGNYNPHHPSGPLTPNHHYPRLGQSPTYHRYDQYRYPPHLNNYHSPYASGPLPAPPLPSLPSFPGHHYPHHPPSFDPLELSSSKSHIEEIALFIVVLTIAGLFGLLIAMFVPFILLLQGSRGALIPTNVVPTTGNTGSNQGLIGKRKKRNLLNGLQILRSIHETSQRYQR